MINAQGRDCATIGPDDYHSLSLWQPWASLMAIGEKYIETRTWGTDYRGWLAIHATKKTPQDLHYLITEEPFRSALATLPRKQRTLGNVDLGEYYLPHLPEGAIVAMGYLCACKKIASHDHADRVIAESLQHGKHEAMFGDFSPGRTAWIFRTIIPIDPPIPTGGGRGLWHWRPNDADRVRVRELLASCPDPTKAR